MVTTTRERTAVVTAAGGAIGTAVTQALLEQQIADRVIALDVRRPDTAAEGRGAPVRWHEVDLINDDLQPVLADIATTGGIDVLVNVFGGERSPAVALNPTPEWPIPEVWDDIFTWNVAVPYRVTRALRPFLYPGAAVCNVSSIAADLPWEISPAYGAAKAALEHWSRTLAAQLATSGVRVNVVRPGFVWSAQWAAITHDEFTTITADRIPLAQTPDGTREQHASDVADTVAFLTGPRARHLTGQIVAVDGGASLMRAAR